jgi:hypothetical protein
MAAVETRKLTASDPIKVRRKEDTVFERDVMGLVHLLEWGSIKVCSSLWFVPGIDRMSGIPDLNGRTRIIPA